MRRGGRLPCHARLSNVPLIYSIPSFGPLVICYAPIYLAAIAADGTHGVCYSRSRSSWCRWRGSPFSSQRRLPPEIEANLKAKYGFDQPKHRPVFRYMGDCRFPLRNAPQLHWQGYPDFGDSTKYKDKSVNQIIKEALPVSAVLGLFAYSSRLRRPRNGHSRGL